MMFLQKSSHNFCHFTHFSQKGTTFWGFSNYKTLLFVVLLCMLFSPALEIHFLRLWFPKCCKMTPFSYSYWEASQYETCKNVIHCYCTQLHSIQKQAKTECRVSVHSVRRDVRRSEC